MISTLDILKARILIVDDTVSNVRLLQLVLKDAGYSSVISTTDSREVFELHRIHDFDLILLDLLMPGMDGFQVMEGLKEFERDGYLPVLVTTALQEHKVRALKLGAKDFVGKPFDRAELLVRVHNMLEVRLLYKELHALTDT
jgi:adenylate cyclase